MKRFPRPSPAMVVALLPLVLAAAGTATAALSGKDKRKVKSIADREIAAKAGSLSVLNATNGLEGSTGVSYCFGQLMSASGR